MYTLLLADDEILELESLKDCIDWRKLGITRILTAANGKEALMRCEENRVDIAVTDIKMPVMDGIRFAKTLLERGEQTKVIFLSGYDDFRFVHDAYEAGGNDYILKPFSREEVTAAVLRAKERLEVDRRPGLLSRWALLGDKEAEAKLLAGGDSYPDSAYLLTVCTNAPYALFMQFERQMRDYCRMIFGSQVILVLMDSLHRIKNMISRIEDITSAPGSGYFAFYIYSGEKVTISKLHERCRYYLSMKQYFFYSNGVNTIDLDTFQPYEYTDYGDEERKSEAALKAGRDPEKICEGLRAYYQKIQEKRIDPGQVLESSVNLCLHLYDTFLSGRVTTTKKDYLEQIVACTGTEELRQRMEAMAETVMASLPGKAVDKNSRIVAEVEEYVAQNYGQAITVEELARNVYLSPNYLRAVFKEKTGMTIHECITKYRMEKAASLLKNGRYKVKEIGRETGYENESYFCSSFYKYYGVSPKEYRKTFLGR